LTKIFGDLKDKPKKSLEPFCELAHT
jgi:hypothetical protein